MPAGTMEHGHVGAIVAFEIQKGCMQRLGGGGVHRVAHAGSVQCHQRDTALLVYLYGHRFLLAPHRTQPLLRARLQRDNMRLDPHQG